MGCAHEVTRQYSSGTCCPTPGPCPTTVLDQEPIGIVFGWPAGTECESITSSVTAYPGGTDPYWPLPFNQYGNNFGVSDVSGVTIRCSEDGTKWIADVADSAACVGIGFVFEK